MSDPQGWIPTPTMSTALSTTALLLLIYMPCAYPGLPSLEPLACGRVYGPRCRNMTGDEPEFNCTSRGNFRVYGECNSYYKCALANQQPCMCDCRFKFMYFDHRVHTCQFLAVLTSRTNCRNARSRFMLYGLRNDSAASPAPAPTPTQDNVTIASSVPDQQQRLQPPGKRHRIHPEGAPDTNKGGLRTLNKGFWRQDLKEGKSVGQQPLLPVVEVEKDQQNSTTGLQ